MSRPEDYIFPDYAAMYLTKSKDGENDSGALSAEFRKILVAASLLGDYKPTTKARGGRAAARQARLVSIPYATTSSQH